MPMVLLLIAGALALGLTGAVIGVGVGAAAGYYFAPRWYPYPVAAYPPYYSVPPMYPGRVYYPGYW